MLSLPILVRILLSVLDSVQAASLLTLPCRALPPGLLSSWIFVQRNASLVAVTGGIRREMRAHLPCAIHLKDTRTKEEEQEFLSHKNIYLKDIKYNNVRQRRGGLG
ncbi:hypothetical protein AMECASPLE_028316 [Ameca splendens]|uniref:Secreted protein n=1 Tax=Ameca splendens TaxID=208324 RepID=A0ABV0ZEA5_9TELE